MAPKSKLALLVLLCWRVAAQDTQSPDVRFRVSTNLVQVDAIVTAPAGRSVPPLKAEDFEILEDGRPQRVTSFSGGEHRTVVVLVENCNTPFGPIEDAVHRFLREFVPSGIRSGDRVSILNGTEGAAAAQQLTDDPRLLREQASQIYVPPRLRNWCILTPGAGLPIQTDRMVHYWADDRIRALKPLGWPTLVLQDVSLAIDYLREQAGHKDLVLIGLAWMRPSSGAVRAVDELTSRANRAGVTVHVVVPGGFDSPPPVPLPSDRDQGYEKNLAAYTTGVFEESMLARMAHDTGGLLLTYPPSPSPLPNSRLKRTEENITGMPSEETTQRQVRFLEESWESICSEYGLYTLGYRPEAVADGYHKLSVRVRQPGLTVHARKGYYDTPAQPPAVTASAPEPLPAVLDAPLHGSAIRFAATPFDTAERMPEGRFRTAMRLVLSIDPRDLTWEDQAGRKKALVQVAAVAHGDEHRTVSTGAKDCELAWPENPRDARAQCVLEMPFDAPGMYVVRAAVRDRATGKTGSAYAVAAVPDHNPGRLTLSDAVLLGVPRERGRFADTVFAPGGQIEYHLEGYGMKVDKRSGQPKLTFRMTLASLTKGRNVFQGDETPVNTAGASWRATMKGKVALPNDLEPGDYTLEFWVTDKLGKVDLLRFVDFRVTEQAAGAAEHRPAG